MGHNLYQNSAGSVPENHDQAGKWPEKVVHCATIYMY